MNVVEIATADAVDVETLETLLDLSSAFAPAPAQLHPRQYGFRRVTAVASVQPMATRSRVARMGDFTDFMEMAFGGLVFAGALLFGAGLLRIFWIDGQPGNAVLSMVAHGIYAVAALVGGGTLYSAGRGIYCLLRR